MGKIYKFKYKKIHRDLFDMPPAPIGRYWNKDSTGI
jgi:hypothetical protein